MTAAPPHALAPPRHVPALDGLRGLAALLVLVSHLAQSTGLGANIFRAGGGQLGVMLFFALSGFLMAHVYWPSRPTGGALWSYGVARVARVVPLYLIVVLGSYAATSLCDGAGCLRAYAVTEENLADHLLLRQGVNVLWTIPVEMRFYLLFPLLWGVIALSRMAGAALIAGLLTAYAIVPGGEMPIMKLGHYFLIGCGGWLVWRLAERHGVPAPIRNLGFGLAALALLAMLPGPFEALLGRPPARMWWEPWIACAVAALLLTSAASPVAGRLLGSRPLRWLGAVSYSLYLTHMLVLMNLRALFDPAARPAVFFALTLVLSLGLAGLSFRYLERPSQAWLRRLARPASASGQRGSLRRAAT